MIAYAVSDESVSRSQRKTESAVAERLKPLNVDRESMDYNQNTFMRLGRNVKRSFALVQL